MNDRPLAENIAELSEEIGNFRGEHAKWWPYNYGWSVALLLLGVFSSAGATVAGIWDHPHLAATLAALGGLIITLQNGLRYAEKAHKNDLIMTECDRLSDKLKFQTKAPADFDSILEAFHKLRSAEQDGATTKRGNRRR